MHVHAHGIALWTLPVPGEVEEGRKTMARSALCIRALPQQGEAGVLLHCSLGHKPGDVSETCPCSSGSLLGAAYINCAFIKMKQHPNVK